MRKIRIDDIEVEITYKRVKNLNLRVYPAEKRVAVSCPPALSDRVLKTYLKGKAGWIKTKLNQPAKPHPVLAEGMRNGDTLTVWGKPYTLQIKIGQTTRNSISLQGDHLFLCQKKEQTTDQIERILTNWYRKQVKMEIVRLIDKWEPVMGVQVHDFGVKRMKTRWGTCNVKAQRIWLNLILIEKPIECLEFVVVHEMTHLLERLHTPRFYRLMDQFLPDWKLRDNMLR